MAVCLCNGLDKTVDSLCKIFDNICILNGLFITVSLSAVLTPPDSVVKAGTTNQNDYRVLCYYIFTTLSVICFALSLIISTAFTYSISSAPRKSDVLNLLYYRNSTPMAVIILFTLGACCLFTGIGYTVFI